jgi:hypothetical protein
MAVTHNTATVPAASRGTALALEDRVPENILLQLGRRGVGGSSDGGREHGDGGGEESGELHLEDLFGMLEL